MALDRAALSEQTQRRLLLFGSWLIAANLVGIGRWVTSARDLAAQTLDESADALQPLASASFSEVVWFHGCGLAFDAGHGPANILLRESPGLLLLLAVVGLPPLVALTALRSLYLRMGLLGSLAGIGAFEFLVFVPLRWWLRSAAGLKYIVYIPEYFFNI